MITKDEIQELLRMFSSEDDVTSLSQALSLFIEFGQYKVTEPAEVIESVHVNEIVK